MIIPKVDSRSKQFSYFNTVGGSIWFEDEYVVDSPIPDSVQPPGSVSCTSFSITGVCEDMRNQKYDHDELYSRIPHTNGGGADPIIAIKTGRDGGVVGLDTKEREYPYRAFYEAHSGSINDAFDNVRSALKLCGYSIMGWSEWHEDWGLSEFMTFGRPFRYYHAWQVKGWKQVNGEPHLIINAHIGRPLYINRENFNKMAKTWAFGTAVLANDQVKEAKVKTLMETLIDLMKNLVIQLQADLLAKKKVQ